MKSLYLFLLLLQLRCTWCNLDSDGEEEEYSNFYSDVYDDDTFDIMEQADKLFDASFSSELGDLSNSLNEALSHTESFGGMVDSFDKMTASLPVPDMGDCKFNCEKGFIAVQREGYTTEPNGCGATLGMLKIKLNTTGYEGIERCCDRHDMCYSACNDPRKYCDDSFRDCMVKYCDTDPGIKLGYDGRSTDVCVSAAEMMYLGVETFGCTSYLEAQREACECRGDVKQKVTLKKGKKKSHTPKSEF